jgi:hypothetical protein
VRLAVRQLLGRSKKVMSRHTARAEVLNLRADGDFTTEGTEITEPCAEVGMLSGHCVKRNYSSLRSVPVVPSVVNLSWDTKDS